MNSETELPAAAAPSPGRGSLTALMIVSGIGGLVLGTIIASSIAAALADGLGLGQLRERLDFTASMGFIGAPTGLFLAQWLVLRARLPDARNAGLVVGIPAAIGLVALAIHGALFAALTPPPPVLPYLTVEIRITPGSATVLNIEEAQIAFSSGRHGQGGAWEGFAKDSTGRDVLRSTYWLSRQSSVDAVSLYRRGKPAVRFTLNLPPDLPSITDFTQWLQADAPTAETGAAAGEKVELRFRIDRRVAK